MILFTTLLLGLLLYGIYFLVSIGIKGIAFIFVYGDIIICVLIIAIIIKHILKKKD